MLFLQYDDNSEKLIDYFLDEMSKETKRYLHKKYYCNYCLKIST